MQINVVITYQRALKSNTMTTDMIRITSKCLTKMFCLTVAHHDVLKGFLAILF